MPATSFGPPGCSRGSAPTSKPSAGAITRSRPSGDRERAIGYYARALPLAERAGDREQVVSVLDSLGVLHYGLAEDEPAIDFTRRALSIYEEDGCDEDVMRLRERLEDLESD